MGRIVMTTIEGDGRGKKGVETSVSGRRPANQDLGRGRQGQPGETAQASALRGAWGGASRSVLSIENCSYR